MRTLKQILTEDYEYGDVEVPDKYDDLDFEPPAEAQDNAQQVIDWKEEHGEDEVKGMTQTGWQRANQLADGVEVSPDVISRMAQFARHEDNAEVSDENEDTPWKDRGRVAWLGWGGKAGVEWAQEMQDKMDDKDQQNEMKLTQDKLRNIIREELNEAHRLTTAKNLEPYIQGKTISGTRKGEGSLHEGEIVIQFQDGSEMSIGRNGGILFNE